MKRYGPWAVVVTGGAVALSLAAFACIPDLSPVSGVPEGGDGDAGSEGGAPPSMPRCGDGIIQLEREQCDPGVSIAPDASFGGCTGDCQMVCNGFVWPKNDHCYTLFKTAAASLDEAAESDCVNASAHVATFASEEELQVVMGALDAGRPYWVGLNGLPGDSNGYFSLAAFEPGWSPECAGCYAHAWTDGGPLPAGPQDCVEGLAELDASWQQYPCADAGKITVVCEREPLGTLDAKCDGGVCIELRWSYGAKRYLYVSARQNAADAESRCVSLGGTLVVLQSRDEREQLWHELAKLTSVPTEIWIGLSLSQGVWTWDDGATVDAYAPPWAEGQPSGGGTRAYAYQTPIEIPQPVDMTLAKSDVPAGTSYPYVCQLPTGDGGL